MAHHSLMLLVLLPLVIVAFKWYFNQRRRNPRQLPYPPGLRPWPIIGNNHSIPTISPWKTYTAWKKQYGDIFHFRDYFQHIVVVSSEEIANEIFVKRSNLYSDRPYVTMIHLTGWDFNMGSMGYGDKWRKHRRMFHQKFRPEAAVSFIPSQTKSVHGLLRDLLESPDDLFAALRTMAGGVVMSAVYGYQIERKNDHFVKIAEEATNELLNLFFPGAALVNAFPMLQHLPDWFPGTHFKKIARECRKLTEEMQEVPFAHVKQKMGEGTAVPCVTTDLLERHYALGGSREDEDVIKRVSGVAYAAGADTTVAVLASSILAMVKFPEAAKKAQAEIDEIIGPDRLPNHDDRRFLPYVEAFYREVNRLYPVAPLGVGHAVSEDDVYDGMYIPKGTVVIPNIWAMSHNPDKYPDPFDFKPERYLDADGWLNDDSRVLSFGFGRRTCPGRHFADFSIWASLTSMLSTFTVTKVKDDAGNDIEVLGLFTGGLISHPLPFPCSITPRSEEAKRLILATKPL